ncbi:ABC transporter permease [Laceyella putida]|uniref:ABC transporter permease n=1 Tax=Laceyella putida TaxID=110101 RepID=A0ABW2RLZ1_9BACL
MKRLGKFGRLVKNELMKVFVRPRTAVLLGVLISIVFGTACFLRYVAAASQVGSDIWGFAFQCSHMLLLPLILSLIVAGDIVSCEFGWGTIKLLLIRPASRTKILYAKYAAALLFSVVSLALFFVMSLLFGLVFFGWGSPDKIVGQTLAEYGYYFIQIVMMVTLAFAISTVSRSSSLGIGLSMFLMFIGMFLVEILKTFGVQWGKYLLAANLDLGQYEAAQLIPFAGMSLGFSTAVLVVHFLFFHVVAWIAFTKRDVAV